MSLLSKIISLGIIISSVLPQLKTLPLRKEASKNAEALSEEPPDEALLTEYQTCQQDSSSSALSYWTLTGIFIGFSSALLGGLIYGILANNGLFDNVFSSNATTEKLVIGMLNVILGTAILIMLYFLKGWLKRVRFLQQINFERMRDIEHNLGIRKSWRVHGIDNWKDKSFDDEKINKLEQKMLFRHKPQEWWEKHRTSPIYEIPSSRRHFKGIFCALFSLWTLVLFSGLALLSFYSVVADSFIALWVVLGVTVFILSVILLCKRLYK